MGKYFNWPLSLKRFIPFDVARAKDVNGALDELSIGMELLDKDIDRAIKLPLGTADQSIGAAPVVRANKSLIFDANGNAVLSEFTIDKLATSSLAALASATEAALQAGMSASSAAEAAMSSLEASKFNFGPLATEPVLDNEGGAIRKGAVYFDTTLGRIRVWKGSAWGDGISVVAGVRTINGQDGDVTVLRRFDYADRSALRALTGLGSGDAATVDGLGAFVWLAGSTEPDDDESCFATATGCWLMQAPSWDLVTAWQLPETEDVLMRLDAIESILAVASPAVTQFFSGSALCAVTSVGSNSSVSFAGTVMGARVGDAAVVALPAPLEASSSRLFFYAWVSATNTVTVQLSNPYGSAATTNPAVRVEWPVTVIRGV